MRRNDSRLEVQDWLRNKKVILILESIDTSFGVTDWLLVWEAEIDLRQNFYRWIWNYHNFFVSQRILDFKTAIDSAHWDASFAVFRPCLTLSVR